MRLENEERIIQEAKKNKEMFSALYKHYVSQIYYFLLARIKDKELAEDLTSITFAKALRYLDKYEAGNFRAWLYRIANNSLIDHVRKESRVSQEDEQVLDYFHNHDEQEEHDDRLDKEMQLERVKIALKELPESYQTILSLRFFSDLGNQEIAKIIECKENNVAVKIHRGLKMLTKVINNA